MIDNIDTSKIFEWALMAMLAAAGWIIRQNCATGKKLDHLVEKIYEVKKKKVSHKVCRKRMNDVRCSLQAKQHKEGN